MDRFWKQFVGLDTASDHNVFLKARLRLTFIYVIIVAVIVIGFSLFLYQSISRNLTDANDEDFSGVESHQHLVSNTLNSVENDLIFADIIILIVSAGLSFMLAGKTLKPIQKSVEAQKAFAANASHELRTPLAVMRNDIEVFMRNQYPTKELIHKTMNSNLEEIKHMSGMVEDLLLLARSDDQLVLEHKDIDFSIVVKNVVERMKALTDSKGIKLTDNTSGQFLVRGNQRQLERVVINILQNSIDHTPSEGSIDIKVEKEGSKIMLKISDTGSGISVKDLPHIFNRFYKGNSAKGTGLGLSIVKKIIDQHRGHISVESVEGKGTTVTLTFSAV